MRRTALSARPRETYRSRACKERKMLTRRALMAAGAAAATAPLAANRTDAATPRDMIVVARHIDDIISFDPAQSYHFNEDVDANIYRKLVSSDLSNLTKIRPDLAEPWEVSSDGKTLTFHLAQDVSFSSGKPMTAADAEFSLRRVDPESFAGIHHNPSSALPKTMWRNSRCSSNSGIARRSHSCRSRSRWRCCARTSLAFSSARSRTSSATGTLGRLRHRCHHLSRRDGRWCYVSLKCCGGRRSPPAPCRGRSSCFL